MPTRPAGERDEEDILEAQAIIRREMLLGCAHICTSNCRREGCWCRCGEWHRDITGEKDTD